MDFKIFILSGLLLVTGHAMDAINNQSDAERLMATDDNALLDLVYKKAQKMLIQANQQAEICSQQVDKNKLDPSRIQKYALTQEQWLQAILYLQNRAMVRCTDPTELKAVHALESYFYLEKELTGSNTRPVILKPGEWGEWGGTITKEGNWGIYLDKFRCHLIRSLTRGTQE